MAPPADTLKATVWLSGTKLPATAVLPTSSAPALAAPVAVTKLPLPARAPANTVDPASATAMLLPGPTSSRR
jgi:hypothetical protein